MKPAKHIPEAAIRMDKEGVEVLEGMAFRCPECNLVTVVGYFAAQKGKQLDVKVGEDPPKAD